MPLIYPVLSMIGSSAKVVAVVMWRGPRSPRGERGRRASRRRSWARGRGAGRRASRVGGGGREERLAAQVALGRVAEAEDEPAEGEGGAVAELDGVAADAGAVDAGAILGVEVADGDAVPGAVDFGVGARQVLVEDDPGGFVAAADDEGGF